MNKRKRFSDRKIDFSTAMTQIWTNQSLKMRSITITIMMNLTIRFKSMTREARNRQSRDASCSMKLDTLTPTMMSIAFQKLILIQGPFCRRKSSKSGLNHWRLASISMRLEPRKNIKRRKSSYGSNRSFSVKYSSRDLKRNGWNQNLKLRSKNKKKRKNNGKFANDWIRASNFRIII